MTLTHFLKKGPQAPQNPSLLAQLHLHELLSFLISKTKRFIQVKKYLEITFKLQIKI